MTITETIEALDTARSSHAAALTHWNALVAIHGEDGPQARAFYSSVVNATGEACSNAESAMLEIDAQTPSEFLRKFTAYLDDDFFTCGGDSNGSLMKNAKRLLNAA